MGAVVLAEDEEGTIDIADFDASKGDENGAYKGDFVGGEGNHEHYLRIRAVKVVYMDHLCLRIPENDRSPTPVTNMNARRADQKQLKITVSEDIYSLLKRLAGVKETSMNKVVGEAIDLYLESDRTRELIERYNLED